MRRCGESRKPSPACVVREDVTMTISAEVIRESVEFFYSGNKARTPLGALEGVHSRHLHVARVKVGRLQGFIAALFGQHFLCGCLAGLSRLYERLFLQLRQLIPPRWSLAVLHLCAPTLVPCLGADVNTHLGCRLRELATQHLQDTRHLRPIETYHPNVRGPYVCVRQHAHKLRCKHAMKLAQVSPTGSITNGPTTCAS